MNKLKLVFNQTMMVSSAILFGLGLEALITHFMGDDKYFEWQWYIPLSIITTGFLSSVPSILLVDNEKLSKRQAYVRVILHFFCVWGIVMGCATVFDWYDTVAGFLIISLMYVLIYFFVWAASWWLMKSDEKKINEALEGIRDEE